MRRRRGAGGGEAGMTLVEVAVAMGILSVVMAGFFSVLASATRATRPLQAQSRTVDELRVTISAISRELRSAECIAEPAANAPAGDVLRFTTHANGAAYEVTYSATGGALWRQVTGEAAARVITETLVDTADAFEHIATPRRSVRMTFHVQVDPTRPSRDLSTIVAGRNAWKGC